MHAVPQHIRNDPSVQNILYTLEKAPWVFNRHVQVLTAVFATGAQFLEVIYFKSGFTQFTEERPAKIVALTRSISRMIFILCDPGRCRGLTADFAFAASRTLGLRNV